MTAYVEVDDGQDRYTISAADAISRMTQADGWAEFFFDLDDIGANVIEGVEPDFLLTLRPDWDDKWHLTDTDEISCRLAELKAADGHRASEQPK